MPTTNTEVGSAYLAVTAELSPTAAAGLQRQAQAAGAAAGGVMGKGMGGAFSTASVAMGNLISSFATQAVNAVGNFVGDTIETGKSFDSAIAEVAATMGTTMEGLRSQVGETDTAYGHFQGTLEDFALFLGKNSVYSATEAAEALNYMALAGYDAQTSMDMLPNVMSLAAAGSFDLARASDMVTDTQTAFGISLERTSQMVDEMAKAASTGNTSVEQLGDAFLTVGGLAAELNGGLVTLSDGTQANVDGIQELEIALTAMANAGVKGTEAGTHMRNMLLKLASPTADGTQMLEDLGVAVFDSEGRMRSLSDVMGDLDGALGQLTQEQKIQAISELFNTRDLASAEALLNAVGSDWDGIGESILSAQGAASQMAAVKLDNLEGDVTLLNSALEGLQIELFHMVEPALRDTATAATDLVGGITEGLPAAGEAVTQFYNGNLAPFVERIRQAAEDNKLAEKVEALSVRLQEFASGALKAVTDGLGAILMPILDGLTTLIADHVIPALTDLEEIYTEAIEPVLSEAVTWIGEKLSPVMEFLGWLILDTIIPVLFSMVGTMVDMVVPAIQLIWGWLEQNLFPIFRSIAQFIDDRVVPVFNDIATTVNNTIIPALSSLFSWVNDSITPVFSILADVLGNVWGLLSSIAGTIGDVVSRAGQTIMSASQYGYYGPAFATGGYAGPGQLYLANERGGEFIWPSYQPYLDRYADALASRLGGGGGVTITGNEFNVRTDADIQAIGDELVSQWSRKQRSGRWRS